MSWIITVLLVSDSQITVYVLTRAETGIKSASCTWKALASVSVIDTLGRLQPTASIIHKVSTNEKSKL